MGGLELRQSVPADNAAIESLYPLAFPDEDLVPLVRSLLRDEARVTSLVARMEGQLVGNVILTLCGVEHGGAKAALLGPLAVAASRQRHGVGSALVRAGLESALESGVDLVCVLGDPRYYGRFGFVAETAVEPPYPLPPEWAGAWQSKRFGKTMATGEGKLTVPRQWREPALWAP